jgi:hypothetical protein
MVIVLTLVALYIALFLDPIVTLLAYFHGVEGFGSKITVALVL